jgi:hypothetical protein
MDVENKALTIDDIILMGDTIDKKRLILSKDKYKEVLGKSDGFKRFAEAT